MDKKMGASFTSISRWLWSGKNKEAAPNKSSSSVECGYLGVTGPPSVNLSTVSSPLLKGTVMNFNSKGDMMIDGEYDAVLVPSYGDVISEFDELDWSIGWLESFSPEFQSDDENDGSYAVLVPSYRPDCIEGCEGSNATLGNVIRGVSCDYSADGRKYMEQWLSSLQGR